VHVLVNGNSQDIEPGTSLIALLARYQLQPKHVAVEVNRDLVPRRHFAETTLKEDDQIEIVTLVGGG
jgi:sulfur carrier protein